VKAPQNELKNPSRKVNPRPVVYVDGDKAKKYGWLMRHSLVIKCEVLDERTEIDCGSKETERICLYTMRAPRGNVFRAKVREVHCSYSDDGTGPWWEEEKYLIEIIFRSVKIVLKNELKFEESCAWDENEMDWDDDW